MPNIPTVIKTYDTTIISIPTRGSLISDNDCNLFAKEVVTALREEIPAKIHDAILNGLNNAEYGLETPFAIA
jgi:hypothetical protein